ncbi:MAG: hypothetical protein AAGG51_16360 [Cyanobacteria bacterium P01_G01_bin.54]
MPPKHPIKLRPYPPLRRRPATLILLFWVGWVWSLLLGLGLVWAWWATQGIAVAAELPYSQGVDVIPEQLELSQNTYFSSCAGCHVPIPPQLLPTQRWAEILENPESHFGVNLRRTRQIRRDIPPLSNIAIRLIWDYARQSSRLYREDEVLPSRVRDSRFFWALHPKIRQVCGEDEIDCPERISVQTCTSCHTAAEQFDYRALKPDWANSP